MAERVKFNYVKAPAFRTVHVDGIYGGISPSGFLNVSAFSERSAIPQTQVFELKSSGHLGEEVPDEKVGREGFTRELEVNLVMSPEMVKKFHSWLGEQIVKLDRLNTTRKQS